MSLDQRAHDREVAARVRNERQLLDMRIIALSEFMMSREFVELSARHQRLLLAQSQVMTQYLCILGERITDLEAE